MDEIVTRLDNVLNLELHVRRFMAITGCTATKAEEALTSTRGPRLYRRMLREHFASGGTWAELESSKPLSPGKI